MRKTLDAIVVLKRRDGFSKHFMDIDEFKDGPNIEVMLPGVYPYFNKPELGKITMMGDPSKEALKIRSYKLMKVQVVFTYEEN